MRQSALGGRSRVHFSHATAPKAAPSLARPDGRAVSAGMECTLTLLPQPQCSHCTGAVEPLPDPSYERHDYVQTVRDVEPQRHDTEPELQVGEVHPRDLYLNRNAARIRARRLA